MVRPWPKSVVAKVGKAVGQSRSWPKSVAPDSVRPCEESRETGLECWSTFDDGDWYCRTNVVPVAERLVTTSQRVGGAARRDISRKCPDNMRNLRGRRVRPAAMQKGAAKVVKTTVTTTFATSLDNPGHRRPDEPNRSGKCSRCGKRSHVSQICESGTPMHGLVEREPDDQDKTPCKEIQSVWAMTLGSSPRSQTHGSGSDCFI